MIQELLFENWQSIGGGFESREFYSQWRLINKPIDRHYNLLESLAKLVEGWIEKIF
jgi:hypothetical protein